MSLSRLRNGTRVTKLLWKLAVTFRDLFAHSCDLQNRHCTETFHLPLSLKSRQTFPVCAGLSYLT